MHKSAREWWICVTVTVIKLPHYHHAHVHGDNVDASAAGVSWPWLDGRAGAGGGQLWVLSPDDGAQQATHSHTADFLQTQHWSISCRIQRFTNNTYEKYFISDSQNCVDKHLCVLGMVQSGMMVTA